MIQFNNFSAQGWSCAPQNLPQRNARQPFHWTNLIVKRTRALRIPLTTSVHKLTYISSFPCIKEGCNISFVWEYKWNGDLILNWRWHSQNSMRLRCRICQFYFDFLVFLSGQNLGNFAGCEPIQKKFRSVSSKTCLAICRFLVRSIEQRKLWKLRIATIVR